MLCELYFKISYNIGKDRNMLWMLIKPNALFFCTVIDCRVGLFTYRVDEMSTLVMLLFEGKINDVLFFLV